MGLSLKYTFGVELQRAPFMGADIFEKHKDEGEKGIWADSKDE